MRDDVRAQTQKGEVGQVTLRDVEAFIQELPNEYRSLAIFVYATAASPREAIDLKVEEVNKLIAKLGNSLAMQRLSHVWSHSHWELLLPIYMKGRRAALLKRNDILASDEPPQVYLDRNARPFTLEKVNQSFLRLSRKLKLPVLITLETIARAVKADWKLKLSEMPQHSWEATQVYRSIPGRFEERDEMRDDEHAISHTQFQRTLGYAGIDWSGVEEGHDGELALSEIDAFISKLPVDYRRLAIFVRATAADAEVALNLEVSSVIDLLAQLGDFLTMQNFSNIPVHPDWKSLLRIQIEGRRAWLLRHNGIPVGEEPLQVYLDRDARPMTATNVNAAFGRASKRMNLNSPITLETIAQVVVRAWKRKSARFAETGHECRTTVEYYLRELASRDRKIDG